MSMSVLSFAIVVAGFLSRFQGSSSEAISTVTCDPVKDYAWASNSAHQTPCQVAAALISPCTDGDFNIASLPPGEHYAGPTAESQNPCLCSSVVYSLISACGDCQNLTFLHWSEYSVGCSNTFSQQYFGVIPPGTPVPAWAYFDVVTNDTYNPAAARGFHNDQRNAPEITQANGTIPPT